jgi:hypothetical protein
LIKPAFEIVQITAAAQECQDEQMLGNAEPEFNNSTIAHDGLRIQQINLHIVMIKRRLVDG